MNTTLALEPILETTAPPLAVAPAHPIWREEARAACKRVPPLWPLQNFVAVNPFLGLSDHHFINACDLMSRVVKGGMLMPESYFIQNWQSDRIQGAHLTKALALAQQTLPPPWAAMAAAYTQETLVQWLELKSAASGLHAPMPIATPAERAETAGATPWNAIIVEEISRFCAAYYDAGQSIWRMPWLKLDLFDAWRAYAEWDAGPEVMGLPHFRGLVKSLPATAEATLAWAVETLQIPQQKLVDFLHHELMSIRGWAGHVQYRVRNQEMAGSWDDSLLQLLTIRLVYDVAIHQSQAGTGNVAMEEIADSDLLAHSLWHSALEIAWQEDLLARLSPKTASTSPSEKPAHAKRFQAVFCIDVRSERFRRSLESVSEQVETLGFAGFFGLPIEVLPLGETSGHAQCPVLLLPKYQVQETLRDASADTQLSYLKARKVSRQLSRAWNSFRTSAISCFSFVEAIGLSYGAKLVKDSFSQAGKSPKGCGHATPRLDPGIELEAQVQLAMGLLRNSGLGTNLARVVLLCGHGSTTANNPYGSGLDCGACGGHTGEANARVGAALLNHPQVRAALALHGLEIPANTWFVAGLHNTTTDDVVLYDLENAPDSHRGDLVTLQQHLAAAAEVTRRMRADSLRLNHVPARSLTSKIRGRSADWALTRPEWGLAGNAAFIVAPRERTRGLDLAGRAFLHNYDYTQDADNSILELIMTAPMIVTNWINLQYYASTVNNDAFGSGNKVLHNVVGTIGVCLGNGGDLQTGLPLQSLHDGENWVHEPLRLNVIIEAPQDRIAAVLQKHAHVRELVDHGWLHLFSLDRPTGLAHRYLPGNTWSPVD